MLFRVALQKSKQVEAYVQFYNSTLDDMEAAIGVFEQLLTKRQLLSDDPDIQNVVRVMQITHDILLGYLNAHETKTDNRKQDR